MTEAVTTIRCPHCGGEILSAAKKCKHCKAYLDSATPPPLPIPLSYTDLPATSETKACPKCGGEILAAAIKCKHCKTRLDQTAPPAPPASPSGIPQAPAPMPAVPPPSEVQAAGGAQKSSSNTNQCPDCGRYNTSRAIKCIGCGAPLGKKRQRQNSKAGRLATLVVVTVIGAAAVLGLAFFFAIEGGTDHGSNIKRSWAEQEAREARQQKAEKFRQVMNGLDESPDERTCDLLEIEAGIPKILCVALTEAIAKGHLTKTQRATLRSFSSVTKAPGFQEYVKSIFAASAGRNTSEAARTALKALVKAHLG